MSKRKSHRIRKMRVGGSMGAGDPGQGAGHGGPSGAGGNSKGTAGGSGGASSSSGSTKTYKDPETGLQTSYGAPVHTDPVTGDQIAQGPDKWAGTKQRVGDYNSARREYNKRGALNRIFDALSGPMYNAVAPDIDDPKTYWGGQYHTVTDPIATAAMIAGMGLGVPGLGGAVDYATDLMGVGDIYHNPKPTDYQSAHYGMAPDAGWGPAAGGSASTSSTGGGPTGGNTGGGGALSQIGALSGLGTNPVTTTAPEQTPNPANPSGALNQWAQIYHPFSGDYATYGMGQEHPFFEAPAMAEGGTVKRAGRGRDTSLAHVTPGEIMLPPELYGQDPDLLDHILRSMNEAGMDPDQYMVGGGGEDEYNDITGMPQYGFWKTIKKVLKHVAPVAIGTGVGYLTGSPIAGGLSGGLSSKLFGNSWGEAALSGLGSGALSSWAGDGSSNISGLFNGLSSSAGQAASQAGSSAASAAGGSGLSGMFDSALNWVKDNPIQAGGAALTTLAALKGAGGSSEVDGGALSGSSADDPAYTNQIRKGWAWDQQPTDTTPVNWYTYGQMPEWNFFTDEEKFHPMKRGGKTSSPGNSSGALSLLHSNGGQAQGPGGGQDDKIPVMLSAKEYVIPADVVSDLGDGNPDHGAKKLDKLRDKVRKQKGRKGFPDKAYATVEKYL